MNRQIQKGKKLSSEIFIMFLQIEALKEVQNVNIGKYSNQRSINYI